MTYGARKLPAMFPNKVRDCALYSHDCCHVKWHVILVGDISSFDKLALISQKLVFRFSSHSHTAASSRTSLLSLHPNMHSPTHPALSRSFSFFLSSPFWHHIIRFRPGWLHCLQTQHPLCPLDPLRSATVTSHTHAIPTFSVSLNLRTIPSFYNSTN